MNKITFPRTDVDGTIHSKKDVLNYYCNKIEVNILKRLKAIKVKKRNEKYLINDIIVSLHDILVAPPSTLNKFANHYHTILKGMAASRQSKLRGQIATAFNYDN